MKLKSNSARIVFLSGVVLLLFFSSGFANAQKKHLPATLVDLNTASAAELQQVPGIGPATAKSIINFREKSGPFHRVEDILVIHGISKQGLERMRPYITVSHPGVPPKTAT